MDVAVEFLENKELFLKYELCEPVDNDAPFKEKIIKLPLFESRKEGLSLYSTTYSVKVASYANMFKKTEYVSCKAKVFSDAAMRQGKIYGLVATGLVFSEPINNKAAKQGFMAKTHPTDYGNGWKILLLAILFIFVWGI